MRKIQIIIVLCLFLAGVGCAPRDDTILRVVMGLTEEDMTALISNEVI